MKFRLDLDWSTVEFDVKGEVERAFYNEKTQDFTLLIPTKGLKVTIDGEKLNSLLELQGLPIVRVVLPHLTITPTWKPNRYGQLADENAFQQVTVEKNQVVITVAAQGTPEEVFERYNPYEVYGQKERVYLDYNEAFFAYYG